MRPGTSPVRFFLWALCLAAGAGAGDVSGGEGGPLPDSRLGRRTAPLLLLSRPDVREDLGMTPEQAASAEDAIRSMYVQASGLRKRPNDAETVRARRAIDQAMQGWIDSRLSESQRDRLRQIDLQWEGPSALVSRPIVTEAMNLSPSQVQAIQAAVKTRDAARAKGQGDGEGVLARDCLGILSESQKASWKDLLGKPFVPRSR